MSHPLLQLLVPIADGIAKTIGDNCEVAIHDLTHPTHSIYYIVNGELSGRKKGDSLGPGFKEFVELAAQKEDSLINYYYYENGHALKCTKVLIRDENEKIIGCFCINIAIEQYLACKQMLDAFCHTTSLEKMKSEKKGQSEPDYMISDLAKEIIINSFEDFRKGKGQLSKAERNAFVNFLNQKGIFQVKGAVETVAELLNVSRYTVYRYIGENNSEDD